MSHVLTDDQMAVYVQNMKTAKELLEKNKKELAEGEQNLREMGALLQSHREDIQVLLAFIKSRGLQPPKIHTA